MTHTTQQLQAMSDFEVNKAIMVKLGFKLSNWLNNNYGHYEIEGTTCLGNVKDYCNNHSETMPLQIDKRLSLIAFGPYWVCTNNVDGYKLQIRDEFERNGGLSFMSSNPLRAIACLLLMMED